MTTLMEQIGAGPVIAAEWDGNQEVYIAHPITWYSDGVQWWDDDPTNTSNKPVDTPEFQAAVIKFIGGPCEGEIVA